MLKSALILLAAVAPQGDFLPLKDGLRWTYVVEDLGAEATTPASEVVAEVGGTTDSSDSGWMEVRNYLGYRRCWLRETSEGISLKIDPKEGAPALMILKTSAKTGDTWTGTLGRDELRFTCRGEETLVQGDARLQALHVEFSAASERHAGHTASHGDVWFAAGTGVVRAQLTTDLDCHTAMTKVYQLKP
jgi:hypothetical protein